MAERVQCPRCGAWVRRLVATPSLACDDCRLKLARAERDQWIRWFNRLDAAINHHKRDVQAGGLADDPDERLWKARDRILRDAAC